jgi:hypothetical protein
MMPYWYKLLKFKSQGATGLTIPFLIGASKFIVVPKELTVSDFIFEISNNEHGEVMLKYCNQTRDFILTVSNDFILAKSYINHLAFRNLLVVPEKNIKGLDDLDHIIASFEIDYNHLIQQEKYSIVNGDSREFSKEDLFFIKKCLND